MNYFRHYDFWLKPVIDWRRPARFPAKMTWVHARTTEYWESLVFGVVLVLESKGLSQQQKHDNIKTETEYPFPLYSQTCVQRSPLGNGMVTVIYRVTAIYRDVIYRFDCVFENKNIKLGVQWTQPCYRVFLLLCIFSLAGWLQVEETEGLEYGITTTAIALERWKKVRLPLIHGLNVNV